MFIVQSPLPHIELTDVRQVSMMESLTFQIKVPSGTPDRFGNWTKGHLVRTPKVSDEERRVSGHKTFLS